MTYRPKYIDLAGFMRAKNRPVLAIFLNTLPVTAEKRRFGLKINNRFLLLDKFVKLLRTRQLQV